MSEVKVTRERGMLKISCGNVYLTANRLVIGGKFMYLSNPQLDDLYAVLHAREQAKQWKQAEKLLDKIDKLKDVSYTHDVQEFDLPKRCDTCKYWDKDVCENSDDGWCCLIDFMANPDFFCKYYERREE